MNTTDKVFLQQLRDEILNGDHDCQASPRFWVIMDYKDEVTAEGHHDDVHIYDTATCHVFKTIGDYIESVEERIENDEFHEDNLEEILDCIDLIRSGVWNVESEIEDLFELVGDKEDIVITFTKRESYIVPNRLFLTKKEAKNYLKLYGYNHTDKAHTYAMTAVRSPNYQRLIELIENI